MLENTRQVRAKETKIRGWGVVREGRGRGRGVDCRGVELRRMVMSVDIEEVPWKELG